MVRILRLKEMLEKETIIYLKDLGFQEKKTGGQKSGKNKLFPNRKLYILTRSMKGSGKPGQINQELQIAEKSNK